MFDLNEMNTGGTVIFNNGKGGLVRNVTVKVAKKEASEPDTYPDFKIIAKDKQGAEVNQGFYYFKENEKYDKSKNDRNEQLLVSRVLSIAKAATADVEDFKFPEVSNSKDALNKLFKIIRDNSEGKEFNVYVTYGTVGYPSKYLGFRFFDFIELNSGEDTKLYPKNGDLLDRIQEDSPNTDLDLGGDSELEDEDWI